MRQFERHQPLKNARATLRGKSIREYSYWGTSKIKVKFRLLTRNFDPLKKDRNKAGYTAERSRAVGQGQ